MAADLIDSGTFLNTFSNIDSIWVNLWQANNIRIILVFNSFSLDISSFLNSVSKDTWEVIISVISIRYELYFWIFASSLVFHAIWSIASLVHFFPAVFSSSSLPPALGRPLLLFLAYGLHSISLRLHLPASLRIALPVHFHFRVATYYPISVIPVFLRIRSVAIK